MDHRVERGREQAWSRWLRRGLVGFVLLVCAAGIAVLTLDVARRIGQGATASSDAVQWTLSQTDVELLALDVAVHDALLPEINENAADLLAEVRKRFDVFYSRVQTLGGGSLFADLREDPEFSLNYLVLQKFLRDRTALIDGPDDVLQANLLTLHRDLTALRKPSRQMSLAGLRSYSRLTEASRTAVERTLLVVGGLTVVFILTLLALVLVLARLDRLSRLRASEVETGAARLAAIVATARDAVITVDGRDRIDGYNAAAERIFGHSRAEAVGLDMVDLLAEPSHRAAMRAVVATAEVGNPAPERHRLMARHKAGHVFPVELVVSAAGGTQPRLTVAFLRDLTDEVAAEAVLVQARDEARAGERAKAELLAVMSHEVRTPLNGLLGTLDLLGRTRLSGKQQEYLRILNTSGKVLLQHVNDVLDISRLDSGQMRDSVQALDLRALAQEVLDNQAAPAAARGNALTLVLELGEAPGLVSDAGLLRQVLLNLVSNAVKFTERGRISLAIRHLPDGARTEFAVRDSGIGIPPQHLDRIFEDFVTLDPSYARRQGGTGLGLGIARRIVERLGGKIRAESRVGQGSLFVFDIPAPRLGAVAIAAEAGTGPGGRVSAAAPVRRRAALDLLVVEDNPINRQVLREMLAQAGHRVSEAEDGTEGLRLAGQRLFDAILMDISMPGMDGLEALGHLRADAGGPNRATPVMAMTAHALPKERKRFLEAGMATVLVKPFTSAELCDALATILPPGPDPADGAGWATVDGAAAGGAAPVPSASGTIGADPVATQAGRPQRRPLRKAAGPEAAAPLARAAEVARAAPGATARPPSRTANRPDRSGTAPSSGSANRPSVGRAASLTAASRKAAAVRVEPALHHLVPAFLSDGRRALAEIAGLAEGDAAALQRAVHRLAGSSGLIGAKALARKLNQIETALKAGDMDKARQGLADLPALWAGTEADLAPLVADQPPPGAGSA